MNERQYITVVSGMPRSGTSLMMQMLGAGGLPLLTDHVRQPDAHNPLGYFEFEPVKRMAQDTSWMAQARGRAVKIIYRLLPQLPAAFEYRVVFMRRAPDEIFASQQEMLGESATDGEHRIIAALKSEIDDATRWLAEQPHIKTMPAPYAEILAQPAVWAKKLSHFLDGLDDAAMTQAIQPQLRHHC